MAADNYRKTLLAVKCGFITQAIPANFLPLLYVSFQNAYDLSLMQISLISSILFFTQLVVDFACAKLADRIGYRPCMVTAQIASAVGIVGLTFLPDILPSAYVGILVCVVVYAIGSGIVSVLINPIIESCPSESKAGTLSMMHSFYCWGSAGVIILSTLFFTIFGIENWRILAVLFALIPVFNIYNCAVCPIGKLVSDGESMTIRELFKAKIFWLFILIMICAGASEQAMSQWASAFAESALHISKSMGDILGPCGFVICMGVSRTLYGKYSKKLNLPVSLTATGLMCIGCYLLAGLSGIPILGLIGCALCGFSVGIMWPGSASLSYSILTQGGTALFAFLALAGDLGGTAGPALVGAVSQYSGNNLLIGMIAGSIFPLLLTLGMLLLRKYYRSGKKRDP